MNLSYLTGRSRLECLKDGFENIPAGSILPMSVTEETHARTGTRTDDQGDRKLWRTQRVEYTINLTGPDGTIHCFRTDPERAAADPSIRPCPAGRGPATKFHSLSTFITYFHLPVPPGLDLPTASSHALLELLEAIVEAAGELKVES